MCYIRLEQYDTLKFSAEIKFQSLKRHSLSTECTYKLGNSWKHGFHTSCEAFVYYYPYHNKMPTKCVSGPDENKVETAIQTVFNTTLSMVFILTYIENFSTKNSRERQGKVNRKMRE